MSQSPDLTGRKIGEYEVISRIGVGGMGVVYEGRQPLIGKRVAVKVLLPQLSNENDLVERFLAEARAVNEIRHRGIVDIFSFGQLPEGSHYFVMEYLEGEGFDTIIKQRAPVPMMDAIAWTCEVLDALGAAHSAGIIHRDIKPSNLFLVNTGRGKPYVKLLDFGIAKLGALPGEASPQTRASVIMGTPDYISPEQARGKPIGPQTDLYAVGCVLFELVTGFRVFRGENTLQTMWSHVEDVPPVPSSIRPDIPPELDELILWALEKESGNRPASAQIMTEHLEALRASVATGPLTPLPLTGQLQRPVGKTPPPSVRARVLSSTPGLAQPTLKTPTAKSGGQKLLRTPAPSSGSQAALRGDTRLSPLTLDQPSPVLPETRASPQFSPQPDQPPISGEAEVPALTDEADLPPARARTPLVLLLLGLLVVIGAAGVFVLAPSGGGGGSPQVTVVKTGDDGPGPVERADPVEPVAVAPVDAVKPPDAVVVKPPDAVKPDAVVVKPPDAVKPDAVVVKPPDAVKQPDAAVVKKGITSAQLEARLAKLDQKLQAREAQTGEKDKVLRQIFEQARKDVSAAETEAQRREAWAELNEIAGQFPR